MFKSQIKSSFEIILIFTKKNIFVCGGFQVSNLTFYEHITCTFVGNDYIP